MRRLLSFSVGKAELAASLDGEAGATGLLMATGGSQTRIGSHRMYERLAKALGESGFPSFRYDRRGVGDSESEDPGFRDSGADIAAAATAFRAKVPGLERMIGFGLCDGASALALHGKAAGLDGIVLVNPWLVEAEAGAPAPAAIRRHYRQRLLSREGWKKIATGAVNYRKLLTGMRKIAARDSGAPLGQEVAAALRASGLRSWLILCESDATAIAAEAELKRATFKGLIEGRETIPSDSHTFARPGDEAALLTATLRALKALGA